MAVKSHFFSALLLLSGNCKKKSLALYSFGLRRMGDGRIRAEGAYCGVCTKGKVSNNEIVSRSGFGHLKPSCVATSHRVSEFVKSCGGYVIY